MHRVHFHPHLVVDSSRLPTKAEQWALEDFEFHATTCRNCHIYHGGRQLCSGGKGMLRPLLFYFVFDNARFYSRSPELEPTIVEISARFYYSRQLLRLGKHMSGCLRPPPRPFNLVRHCSARWRGGSQGWEYVCVEQYQLHFR